MKTVLVYSGGLDSTCLLSRLMKDNREGEVQCINFRYGSKHNEKERIAATRICNEYYGVPLQFVNMDFIGEIFESDLLSSGGEVPEGHYAAENMKKTVVPFRNGIMLSIAIGFAESIEFDVVAMANHSGDHAIYPDCRGEFIGAMRLAAMTGTYRHVGVSVPFIDLDKGDICKIGYDNGAPVGLTWTCYKGLEKHCGKCGACVERKEAFQKYSIEDPTEYLA